MQTIITETLDFGIPGEFASTNPRHIDMPYEVDTAVQMGVVVATKGNLAAPVGTAGFTAKKGIAISTHQHINRGSVGGALVPTMAIPAGDSIAVATMGDVYVLETVAVTANAVTGKDTEAEAIAAAKAALLAAAIAAIPKRGDAVKYDANGIPTSDVSGTDLGVVRDVADRLTSIDYTVVAAKDGGTNKWGVATPSASAKVVIALAL